MDENPAPKADEAEVVEEKELTIEEQQVEDALLAVNGDIKGELKPNRPLDDEVDAEEVAEEVEEAVEEAVEEDDRN